MKARIKGTNIIVECTDTDTLINENIGIKCRHSDGATEVIPGDCLVEIENDFDWQSFRAEAAKDILCAIIQSGYYEEGRFLHQSELAAKYADALINKLKEKEKK